jgi:hypothetical protein
MDVKRITVRVEPGVHERASRLAAERGVSLNTFVTEAIEAFVELGTADGDRWPFAALGGLLVPAADAAGLNEDDLQRHVREARTRIWHERYEAVLGHARTEVATVSSDIQRSQVS